MNKRDKQQTNTRRHGRGLVVSRGTWRARGRERSRKVKDTVTEDLTLVSARCNMQLMCITGHLKTYVIVSASVTPIHLIEVFKNLKIQ